MDSVQTQQKPPRSRSPTSAPINAYLMDAIDWKNDERLRNAEERRRKERNKKRRTRLIAKVKKALGAKYADVLRAWLKGKNWKAAGIPERTFRDRLKKVKIFLDA